MCDDYVPGEQRHIDESKGEAEWRSSNSHLAEEPYSEDGQRDGRQVAQATYRESRNEYGPMNSIAATVPRGSRSMAR